MRCSSGPSRRRVSSPLLAEYLPTLTRTPGRVAIFCGASMTWTFVRPRFGKNKTLSRGKNLSAKLRLFVEALEARETPAGYPAAFTPGDIVVYRIGDGNAALSAVAQRVFLDEYTPTGTLVQTIPMPTVATTADNANRALTASGTATSEGQLHLSL